VRERYLASREEQLRFLTETLKRVEERISQSDLASLPTARLFAIATSLRREITSQIGDVRFSCSTRNIPTGEYFEEVVEWRP
jgi:hypothetical protein